MKTTTRQQEKTMADTLADGWTPPENAYLDPVWFDDEDIRIPDEPTKGADEIHYVLASIADRHKRERDLLLRLVKRCLQSSHPSQYALRGDLRAAIVKCEGDNA